MTCMRINPPSLFDENRAAQAAAYMLRAAGGSLTVLKLIKLLYLAERRSLAEHAVPLIGDVPVSMQHGPVLSRTLDLINGTAAAATGTWDALITERDQHTITLRDGPQTFGALSRADLSVLEATFAEFGAMEPWDLVRYCHCNLSEWEDPGYSAIEIPLRRIFHALGRSADAANAAAEAIEEQAREAEVIRGARGWLYAADR
jgi:uncharacterized phage-associated protein